MPKFSEAKNEEKKGDQIDSKTKDEFEPFKIIMSKTDLDQMILRG